MSQTNPMKQISAALAELNNTRVCTPENASAALEALDRSLLSLDNLRTNVHNPSDYVGEMDEKETPSRNGALDNSNIAVRSVCDNKISEFDREGFCIVKDAVSREQLSLLKKCAEDALAAADKIFEAKNTTRLGMHVKAQFYVFFNPSNHFPVLYDVNYSNAVMGALRKVSGPNAYLIHDQLTLKSPGGSENLCGAFGWHQDRYNSDSVKASHDPFVTCFIPLHEMSDKNGGLRVIPFSRLPESRGPLLDNDPMFERLEELAVTPTCNAGDMICWSSSLIHSSLPNTSKTQNRWGYIAQFSNTPLAMASRNDCAMRGSQPVNERRSDPSAPLLHGVANTE